MIRTEKSTKLALMKKTVAHFFLNNSFQKSNKLFYRFYDELVCVSNFEKTPIHGDMLIVNFGIWLLCLGQYRLEPPHLCHIDFRTYCIPSVRNSDIDYGKIMDIEEDWPLGPRIFCSDELRIQLINQLFDDAVLPFLNMLSFQYLRCEYKEAQPSWIFPKSEVFSLFQT